FRRVLFRAGAAEVHVRIDGVTNPGEHAPLAPQLLARQPHRLAQAKPRLDTPFALAGPVVVQDPDDPLAPDVDVGTVRENRRILDGDAPLVIEAVRHPAPDLLLRQLTRVHALVEGVQIVVRPTLFP